MFLSKLKAKYKMEERHFEICRGVQYVQSIFLKEVEEETKGKGERERASRLRGVSECVAKQRQDLGVEDFSSNSYHAHSKWDNIFSRKIKQLG